MEYFQGTLIILALIPNNLLYFLRLRAIYGKSRNITVLFGCCTFIVFGISLCAPFAIEAAVRFLLLLRLWHSHHSWECIARRADE